MTKIKVDLEEPQWRERLGECRVEEGWTILTNKLTETIEQNVARGGQRTKLNNPWMTREILRLIRRKRRKWRAVKNSGQPEEHTVYEIIEKETANKI